VQNPSLTASLRLALAWKYQRVRTRIATRSRVNAMRISYEDLDFGDLRGNLVADYLIAVDAHLTIDDDGRVILDEPFFPVVELARSLLAQCHSARGL
jgi:hypothetical protein